MVYFYNAFLVNCLWTTWEAWTSCSLACVGGTRTRVRKQQPEAQHGGTACIGEATESQCCGEKALFDIRLSGESKEYEGFVEIKTIYHDWARICSNVTGLEEGEVWCKMLGFHLGVESTWQGQGDSLQNPTESPACDDDLVCNGSENCIFECSRAGYKVENCNSTNWLGVTCKQKLDCQWGEWSSYSSCSVSCAIGNQMRTRNKTIEEQHGGLCQGSDEDTITCTLNPCPSK